MPEQVHTEKQQKHLCRKAKQEAQDNCDAERNQQDESLARIRDVKETSIDLVDKIDLLFIEVLGFAAIEAS